MDNEDAEKKASEGEDLSWIDKHDKRNQLINELLECGLYAAGGIVTGLLLKMLFGL